MVALRNSNYLGIGIISECTSVQNSSYCTSTCRMKQTAGIKTSGRLQTHFLRSWQRMTTCPNQLRKRSLSLRSIIDRSMNCHDHSQGKDHTTLTTQVWKKDLGYHWLSSLNVHHIAMHRQICLHKKHM